MSDDSETVEDTEKGSLAEVTDDSCTVEFIEIVPLDRASDDYCKLEFIDPVVEVKPEDLLEIKQEPADETDGAVPNYYMVEEPVNEYNTGDHNYCMKQALTDEYDTEALCFTIQVSPLHSYSTDFIHSVFTVCLYTLLAAATEYCNQQLCKNSTSVKTASNWLKGCSSKLIYSSRK